MKRKKLQGTKCTKNIYMQINFCSYIKSKKKRNNEFFSKIQKMKGAIEKIKN